MTRPLLINENRVGRVEPLDEQGNLASVDLTQPWEYQMSDPDIVDLSASLDNPLHFHVRFKVADMPVTIAFVCSNLAGQRIRCESTYSASKPTPPPPPPPPLAVGGRLIIED